MTKPLFFAAISSNAWPRPSELECPTERFGAHLARVHMPARERHRRVILVHNLPRQHAHDRGVDVMAPGHFLSELPEALRVADGAVGVLRMRIIVAGGQLQRCKPAVERQI